MNKTDFRELYSVLDLPFDADETQLRQQYRRLAQRSHPDADSGDTERFIAVQRAHDSLQTYLREHGHLPLAYTVPAVEPRPLGGVRRRRRARPTSASWSGRSRWILVSLVALGFLYIVWPRSPQTPELRAGGMPIQQPGASVEPRTEQPTFGEGSPMSEVLDAQGVPDSGDNRIWRYGKSTVHFHDGLVMGWKEHPDSPLHLRE